MIETSAALALALDHLTNVLAAYRSNLRRLFDWGTVAIMGGVEGLPPFQKILFNKHPGIMKIVDKNTRGMREERGPIGKQGEGGHSPLEYDVKAMALFPRYPQNPARLGTDRSLFTAILAIPLSPKANGALWKRIRGQICYLILSVVFTSCTQILKKGLFVYTFHRPQTARSGPESQRIKREDYLGTRGNGLGLQGKESLGIATMRGKSFQILSVPHHGS
ncbi:hypothetical protein L218DRAFT_948855 [Marasmius fiardii PR-910]|nr:hypothetical protein L218DRAFT_948855 [Marasmius fiardii PR-910]